MKVLIVSEGNYYSPYYRPFSKFGDLTNDSELLWTKPDSIELIVFTGGADVSPSLYGEEASRGTSCVPRRDIYESITFHRARMLGKAMVGVCRGAQFLNVMANGKLCQHLNGHGFHHQMETIDGEIFEVSSTHHQMMLPPPKAKVIGWSQYKKSEHYYGSKDKLIKPSPEKEYEVIAWPYIRALGMQYHPETMPEYSRGFKFAAEIVQKHLFK